MRRKWALALQLPTPFSSLFPPTSIQKRKENQHLGQCERSIQGIQDTTSRISVVLKEHVLGSTTTGTHAQHNQEQCGPACTQHFFLTLPHSSHSTCQIESASSPGLRCSPLCWLGASSTDFGPSVTFQQAEHQPQTENQDTATHTIRYLHHT